MKVADLVEEYERRRAEAARHGSRAPLAKVYSIVLDELRQVDGVADRNRMLTTGEAAEILGVHPKTVRRWLADDRFPGAEKTSDAGEWRIPAGEVYRSLEAEANTERGPRLWRPSDE